MPYEATADAEARRAAKAERARELQRRARELDEAVHARLLLALSAQYVRGYDELAALLRVSARAAQDIAARPDFPRASAIGDRVRLWRTERVMAWIDAQVEPTSTAGASAKGGSTSAFAAAPARARVPA